MRNKIAVIALTMLILMASFITVQGETGATISGDFGYSVSNGQEAQITSYAGAGGPVVVPGTIDGYTVTSIGDYAFYSSTAVTAVTVPDGVTRIGKAAFDGCTSLSSVTLPQTLTSIGDYAFSQSGLRTLHMPNSTVSLGDSVFSDCHYLTSVVLSTGLTSLGNGEFADCFNLTSAAIPGNVRSIGDGSYYDCRSLTSIDVPGNVTSIGNSTFQDCTSLSGVGLGPGLKSIGYAAFYRCRSLGSIEIPDGVTNLGYGAFYGCCAMASVRIGTGVSSISALTFCDCTSITSVEIPGGVTAIGYSAFFNCTSLQAVTVGSGVMDIGKSAFGNCSLLSSVTFDSNQPSMASDWIDRHASGLTIHYYAGASGFSTPLWQGVPTEMGTRLAAPQNLNAVAGHGIVSLSWSALAGNGSGSIDHYSVFEDGLMVTISLGANISVPVPPDGHSHSFQIAAHDQNGLGLNSSAVIASSSYDPNSMLINITSPVAGSFLSSAVADVQWTVGVPISGIAHLNISLDGSEAIGLPVNSTDHPFLGLKDGDHSVSINGIDVLGTASFARVTFTVDTTRPTAVTSPIGGHVSTRAKVTVTFSEAMDRTATWIGLGGTAGLTSWNGITASFLPGETLIGNHTYTVSVVGKDLAGNDLANCTWSFTTADAGTVSGKVMGTDGMPVQNANVTLTSAEAGPNPFSRSCSTDPEGAYLFYDVPVGNYTLKVSGDGYATVISSMVMTSDAVALGGTTVPALIAHRVQSFDAGFAMLIGAIASMGAAISIAAVLRHRKRKRI